LPEGVAGSASGVAFPEVRVGLFYCRGSALEWQVAPVAQHPISKPKSEVILLLQAPGIIKLY